MTHDIVNYCRGVAIHLPGMWEVDGNDKWVKMERDDGLTINVFARGEKLSFEPAGVHVDDWGVLTWDGGKPLLKRRSPRAVAGHLERKLLPDLNAWYKAANETKTRQLRHQHEMDATKTALLSLPGTRSAWSLSDGVIGEGWEARITGPGEVQLKIYLRIDDAIHILEGYKRPF